MRAYDLAIQNFSVAEHLLQLHELFRGLQENKVDEPLRLAVCSCFGIPEQTVLRHARNDQVVLVAKATAPIPPSLMVQDGINFLLRQAVVVGCTALESFFWDALRENVLTIVRARRRRADESLKKITLSLDDYLSIEGYGDPDERLQQIILKNFERGTLSNASSIEWIAKILTVKDFWTKVAAKTGNPNNEIKRQIGELTQRRNQIAHRADRPVEDAEPARGTGRSRPPRYQLCLGQHARFHGQERGVGRVGNFYRDLAAVGGATRPGGRTAPCPANHEAMNLTRLYMMD